MQHYSPIISLFSTPSDSQLSQEQIIANAQRFALNSQAALMFYDGDATVQKTYQRFYLLGWPTTLFDYTEKGKREVITGGGNQKNASHAIEFLSASAAFHFFKTEGEVELQDHKWLFKSVEKVDNRYNFSFADFADVDYANQLKKKLTAFFGMCLLMNIEFRGDSKAFYKSVYKGDAKQTIDHQLNGEIRDEEYEKLNRYIRYFSFGFQNGSDHAEPGWLPQIQKSSTQSDFLFVSPVFNMEQKSIKKFAWGQILREKEHHFGKSKGISSLLGRSYFNDFVSVFKENTSVRPDPSLPKPIDRLLNWIYNTFTHLYSLKEF